MNALYSRALSLLARRDHSRLELRRKLLRKGSGDEVEAVIDRLEGKGLLDEESFARNRALGLRRQRLWGNRRITRDLKRLGIDARMIERVLEQVEEEKKEADSLQAAIHLWIGKAETPEVLSQLKKLYDHCVRLGYAPALVRENLQPYFEGLREPRSRTD